MKSTLVFTVLVAIAVAAPAPNADTVLLKQESDVGIDGYSFAYEQSDGSARQETGKLVNIAPEVDALRVRGTIEWVSPDGQKFVLRYIADENGYQPEADFLPVAWRDDVKEEDKKVLC